MNKKTNNNNKVEMEYAMRFICVHSYKLSLRRGVYVFRCIYVLKVPSIRNRERCSKN